MYGQSGPVLLEVIVESEKKRTPKQQKTNKTYIEMSMQIKQA